MQGMALDKARDEARGCLQQKTLASLANAISVKQTPTLMTTQAEITTTM